MTTSNTEKVFASANALAQLTQTNVSQDDPAGNTKSAGSCGQLYRWQFTLRAYNGLPEKHDPIDPESLAILLNQWCKEYYYQLEIGEGGYEHYQGCLSLIVKHRLSEVKNILGYQSVHLEPIRNWNASIRYCSKEDTRVKGPWSHKSIWIQTITQLNWWQSELETILLQKPDYRTIYWIWDSVGNIGKSSFCKYAAVKLQACVLNNGTFSDLAFAIPNAPKIIIWDLPRTIEGRVNYSAIEACKNGLIFSGKYESKTKVFNPPHIVVFANFSPDRSAMSADRWEIICLDTS